MWKVLKATQEQFELIDNFENKGHRIEFYKDISYNWVCGPQNLLNPAFQEVHHLLKELEEILYVALLNIELLPDEEKKYIEIPPIGDLGEERAKKISSELYNIEYPKSRYNEYRFMFPCVSVADKSYIQIDLNRIIRKHSQNDIRDLIWVMDGRTDDAELVALINYVNSVESFPFSHIIPSTVKIYNHNEIYV